MPNAISIVNNGPNKEAVDNSAKAIIEVLEAALSHRCNEVTVKALDALTGSMNSSMDYMTISGCSIDMGSPSDDEVIEDDPEHV